MNLLPDIFKSCFESSVCVPELLDGFKAREGDCRLSVRSKIESLPQSDVESCDSDLENTVVLFIERVPHRISN